MFPVKSAARSKRTKSRRLSWRCLGRHYAEQRLKRWKHLPRVGKAANKQQNCRSLATRLLWIPIAPEFRDSGRTEMQIFILKLRNLAKEGVCTISGVKRYLLRLVKIFFNCANEIGKKVFVYIKFYDAYIKFLETYAYYFCYWKLSEYCVIFYCYIIVFTEKY